MRIFSSVVASDEKLAFQNNFSHYICLTPLC